MKFKNLILNYKESKTILQTRNANIAPHLSRISLALTNRTQLGVVQVSKIYRKRPLKIKDTISLRVNLTKLKWK